MNLNELYTQIITENSRSKENRHPVPGATHSLEGVNPSCGDDITLQLRVKDGKIEDAGFIGSGCAISQASASLMIDLVKGRTVEDARRLISLYFQMIKGKITPEELDDLEDVAALQGIAHVACPRKMRGAGLAHPGGSPGRRRQDRQSHHRGCRVNFYNDIKQAAERENFCRLF